MNLYREVLDNIPTAAIVVDKNMKVRYTNRAFRECFRSEKPKGTLKETTGCASDDVCGEGVRCAYCPMRSLFSDAKKNGGRAFRKLILRHSVFRAQLVYYLFRVHMIASMCLDYNRRMPSAQATAGCLIEKNSLGILPRPFFVIHQA